MIGTWATVRHPPLFYGVPGIIALLTAIAFCHTILPACGSPAKLELKVKEATDLCIETLTETEKKEFLQQKVVGIQKVKAFA
jgi:hypothetical protein